MTTLTALNTFIVSCLLYCSIYIVFEKTEINENDHARNFMLPFHLPLFMLGGEGKRKVLYKTYIFMYTCYGNT